MADMDTYDYANFNRQAGANVETVGMDKSKIITDTIMKINPEASVKNFHEGISIKNLDEFLKDVDVYIDSLDIFALDIRRAVFKRCRELGIPAITAAPMGMGTAMLIFTASSMSFEDYFCFVDAKPFNTDAEIKQIFEDNILRFIIGVSPSMQQRHYLMDNTRVNIMAEKVPSVCPSISLSAGVLCTNVIKLVLKRGELIQAPRGLHFDAYRNCLIKTWRPFGNKNPIQRWMFNKIKTLLKQQGN
ncbi:ThiF family adenylyltransferase [Alishewanella sp. HL-SH06]|uniref:ThiF family adenylyltransferase n=1 Tax=Alishewanella sp. HL-SH06 TaxID=3461144 RepID=UPI004042F8F5